MSIGKVNERLMTVLSIVGTVAVVGLASARRDGDEGIHRRQTGLHTVSQDLHSEIRKRQVKDRQFCQ